jgi:hypothetical protein
MIRILTYFEVHRLLNSILSIMLFALYPLQFQQCVILIHILATCSFYQLPINKDLSNRSVITYEYPVLRRGQITIFPSLSS